MRMGANGDGELLMALLATLTTEDPFMAVAAGRLAGDPQLALAWGQILTEHTAPAEPALRHHGPHHYLNGPIPFRCCRGLGEGPGAACGQRLEDPIHQMPIETPLRPAVRG